ncbi:hypothetical protein V6N13_043399 [Hibiscus sabdariffa]
MVWSGVEVLEGGDDLGSKVRAEAATKPWNLWVSRFGLGFRLVSVSLRAYISKALDKVLTKVLSMRFSLATKVRDTASTKIIASCDKVEVQALSNLGTNEFKWGFVVDTNVITVAVSSKVGLATEVNDTARTNIITSCDKVDTQALREKKVAPSDSKDLYPKFSGILSPLLSDLEDLFLKASAIWEKFAYLLNSSRQDLMVTKIDFSATCKLANKVLFEGLGNVSKVDMLSWGSTGDPHDRSWNFILIYVFVDFSYLPYADDSMVTHLNPI